MIGFNSTLPTFFVEPAPSNGLTGRIGIGNVTAPQAKLHILGDDDASRPDNASLYIQSAGDYYSTIWLGDKDHYIKTKPGHAFEFNAGGNDFYFNDGNLGIGTGYPQAKVHVKDGDIFIEDINHGIVMKSPDGNCWRGTLNNQGQLQFTQMDCAEFTVAIPEPGLVQNAGIRIYPNPTGNHVTVEIPAGASGAALSIKSADGKQLSKTNLSSISNQIDMARYPAGVYFFYISKDDKLMEVKKVVKE